MATNMVHVGLPKQLKEKIIHMYEALLSGMDVDACARFWDEFFVLKPKTGVLTKQLKVISDAGLVENKASIQKLTYKAVSRLEINTVDDTSELCSFNALLTLCVVVEDLSQRKISLDVCDILLGPPSAARDALAKNLFDSLIRVFGDSDNPALLRILCKFLILIVSITDNINDNPFIPYMMVHSFFEVFMRLITDPIKRKLVGTEIVILLGILPHFCTSEPESNPYMQLSVMDPSLELMGIAAVIGEAFGDSTRVFFQQVIALQKDSSWISRVKKTVTRAGSVTLKVEPKDAMLLALCTGLKIGRNFVHAFTHAQSEILVALPTPAPEAENMSFSNEPAVVTPKEAVVVEPSNLFVEFLQYASIVLQHIKEEKPILHAKMSLIILSIITEDHYTTQFMHDFNINYRVQFFRASSRYHPCQILKSAKPEPLACAVLNLISEFIMTHMMLNFPHDLYFRCLLIVYRLMDYQKRTRFRLPYQWRTLWGSLLSLLKFLENNESYLMEQMSNYFLLCTQVVNILNIFLIGGDAILSQVGSYDDLCYEIVRNSSMINNAFSMGLRYSTVQSASTQAAAKRFLSAMANLRSMMTHFIPQIESFSAEHQKTTMERDEILGVIRKNYDNLSLKLVDMTDCFEKHANGTKDKEFIQEFLKVVIVDLRRDYVVSDECDCYTSGDGQHFVGL